MKRMTSYYGFPAESETHETLILHLVELVVAEECVKGYLTSLSGIIARARFEF